MSENSDEKGYRPKLKELYRAFSFELEARMSPDSPSDHLARIVVEDRKREDHVNQELANLRRQFEPSELPDDLEIQKLAVEGQKLDDAWSKFRDILPPETSINSMRRSVDFEDVVSVMKGLENQWQQKKDRGTWGSTKKCLRRVCGAIDSHSTLLKVLPADSQYASVFCGTLQTLIKASANYEKIAAGLSRALLEITEAVAVCAKECALYSTEASISGIARLYASIFCFLRNAIEWYTKKSSKRLLSSFREDFYDKFEDQIANIKQQSALINREAQHASHSELRYMRLRFANFERNMGIGLQGLEREAAERKEREIKAAEGKSRELEDLRRLLADPSKLLRLVANGTSTLLQDQGSTILSDLDTESKEIARQWQSINHPASSIVTLNGPPASDELLLSSNHLEDYIDRDRVLIEDYVSSTTYIDWQVVSALEDWATSGSQFLCIVGQNSLVDMPSTTMLSREYLESANHAKVPTISYFCELPRGLAKLEPGVTEEMSGLISLTYALIRQLIELLPSFISYTKKLGAHRFEKLDGSVESYNEAIILLKELLDIAPPMLLCVVDGLESLDDRSTTSHITAFVNAFRDHQSYKGLLSSSSARVLKVLFTTTGISTTLLTNLDDDEVVFAERSGSARNIRRHSVGRRLLSFTPLRALKHDISQ